MALCKNPRCMTRLKDVAWYDGYCSKHCATTDANYDPDALAKLPHPDDRAAFATELNRNADLFDAMTEAATVDQRLPKIIYLRRKGKTLRDIGKECGICKDTVDRLLQNATPNLLRACGLREKHAQKP